MSGVVENIQTRKRDNHIIVTIKEFDGDTKDYDVTASFLKLSDIGSGDLTIGKTNLEDVFIVGTPTLIQIKDKKITENLVGKTKILEQIK